jgi:hypothetical protein
VSALARRRGALVALAVGVAIVVLYVALQPGDRPKRTAAVASTSTVVTTTTRPPIEELCDLAHDFEQSSRDQDPNVAARLAESFYERAKALAPDDSRPEFDAAARYYTEYNNIGEPLDYDFWAILATPDGARWVQLLFREPLGVAAARANVSYLCQVDLPPPPTVTTTTTTRPRATLPPDSSTPGTTPGSTTSGASTPATSAPATAAPSSAAPG